MNLPKPRLWHSNQKNTNSITYFVLFPFKLFLSNYILHSLNIFYLPLSRQNGLNKSQCKITLKMSPALYQEEEEETILWSLLQITFCFRQIHCYLIQLNFEKRILEIVQLQISKMNIELLLQTSKSFQKHVIMMQCLPFSSDLWSKYYE